jgi:hypothetical protein
MKRQAAESKVILADLEQAALRKPAVQKESFQQKKNRILERCGCL